MAETIEEQEEINRLRDVNAVLSATLQSLIDLKDHKDKHGKDKYYLKNHPLAWDYARNILKDFGNG